MNGMLGARIKLLREASGMTQEEVAEKMHCSRQKLARIEKGLIDISYANITSIAYILGVTPEEITCVVNETEQSKPMYRDNGNNTGEDKFKFIDEMINTFYAHRKLYNSLRKVDQSE